jgi:hypothetical protein
MKVSKKIKVVYGKKTTFYKIQFLLIEIYSVT